MKLFLGMVLAMGILCLPQLEDYWSSNPLLCAKGIVSEMSWRRFRVLLSCLHLADNSLAIPRGQPGFDKLYKVRPLLNTLVSNTQAAYNLHREVSIDEAMIGFKGRSTLKQYMPMKPTKRGYKAWCLCDAYNGLTYNVDLYAGKGSNISDLSLGPSVVLSMAAPVLDKGHCLYFDNYFSSVDLAKRLLARNTHSIATTRASRKQWPSELKDVKLLDKRLQRGQHLSVIIDNDVECLVWKDNKAVSMINTVTPPDSSATVNRKNKDGTRCQVPCPQSVKAYNKFMGGVDLADARRKSYSCSHRSKKWWHRIFYYVVDTAVVNSYILLSESDHCEKRTQKEFTLKLAAQLMGHYNARKRPANPSGETLPAARRQNHYPEKGGKCRRCRVCSLEGGQQRSSYVCKSCNPEEPVHLCIDPCFRVWHEK